jgi:glutamate-ammonia-ligase adenylyltransferase
MVNSMDWAVNILPQPYDLKSADLRMAEFEAAVAQAGLPLPSALTPSSTALLRALFGNSEFLSECAFRDPAFTCALMAKGPDIAAAGVLEGLAGEVPHLTDIRDVMRALRQAKSKVALLTAAADIASLWLLEKITGTLSRFAELSLDLSVAHLIRERMAEGELAPPPGYTPETLPPATPEIARHAGFFILGMGKLGGYELNYSSDIDLIVLFDMDVVHYTGRRHVQDCFVRLTRKLISMMEERTEDGYVFRTDLRLRPDPGATAIALSAEAAEFYYQSIGLNWERAAMIKARPLAGDIATGEEFLKRIFGFVWRKSLDYAALEDIAAIKNQIHRHHGHGDIAVAGHDVKLGRGGIREIEFFAQIHQLVAGGRERELRIKPTLQALATLARLGRVDQATVDDLASSYYFLRRLEHRLQMIRDEQTHQMPESSEGIAHVATFMGYNDVAGLEADLLGHLARVQGHYVELMADSKGGSAPAAGDDINLVFNPDFAAATPEAEAQISALGFSHAEKALEIVKSWGLGRYRACRTPRARSLLTTLSPKILHALGQTADPDATLIKFDEFLSRLPSGVQLFSLLQAHPWLLELLAEIMGMAPALAEILGHRPQLLDAVLSPQFFGPLPAPENLHSLLEFELKAARDFQDVMDISRVWVNERKFQIGVQLLRGLVDAKTYSTANSDLADAVLQCLQRAVEDEFAKRHGIIEGGEMVVVGMGKLGGRELTFTSDIDLIFIYDHPKSAEASTGPKSLPASQYYARLGQSFINALTAMTGEGRLYEVDMRLRPSGQAGPLALSLEAFTQYQQSEAWTWEHLALTRARLCAGPAGLAKRVTARIEAVLTLPRAPLKLLTDTAEMRERLRAEFGTENLWSVKHVKGGLVDGEFICQYLQLKYAHDHPKILATNTLDAVMGLVSAGVLPAAEGDTLNNALTLMNNIQALLRLCVGENFNEELAPKGLQAALSALTSAPDFAAVKQRLGDAQAEVTKLYQKYIELPATPHLNDQPKTGE